MFYCGIAICDLPRELFADDFLIFGISANKQENL